MGSRESARICPHPLFLDCIRSSIFTYYQDASPFITEAGLKEGMLRKEMEEEAKLQARLGAVCKDWHCFYEQATFAGWWDPPLDIMEAILNRCSAADAARLGCVCKSWRTTIQQATKFHIWGSAEGSSRGIASPGLQLMAQPLWSERGGLMPAPGNTGAPQASLVRCAKHLQATIDKDLCGPPVAEAMPLISRSLGEEVAHLVCTITSCKDFSQNMHARSPALEQAVSGSHSAAGAAQKVAAAAAAVACLGGPLAAATAAAADAAAQNAITTGAAAAAIQDQLTAHTADDPWGFWSALMLGMVFAHNGQGVPSLASELWDMTEPYGLSDCAPCISRAQVRELLSAVLLLARHRETGLGYANQLKPLHDMLLGTTLNLETIDRHRAFATMQGHKMMGGAVLPRQLACLVNTGQIKPLTKEQVKIIQNVLSPIKPLPDVVHRITAFAGSGKTHTLRLLAMAYPTLRILYTTFNKDDDPQASEIDNKGFPDNVVRLTTCAIARKETQTKGIDEPRNKAVKDFLDGRFGSTFSYKVVDTVLNAANTWMISSDPELTMEHVRKGDLCELPPKERSLNFVRLAKALYHAMLDGGCREISTPHNAYVKAFVLSGAEMTSRSGGPYDAILLDEAQDVNMVTLQMLLAQPGIKILCGDPNQHIYTFNGCCDSLSPRGPFKDLTQGSAVAGVTAGGVPTQQPAAQPHATQPPLQQQQQQHGHAAPPIPSLRALVEGQYSQGLSLTLSTSFRLGPEIAHVAGRLLADCCHDPRPMLGMGSADAVVFAPEVQNRIVHRFRQMPLLSARNNERYPGTFDCIRIEASSKALALWRRMSSSSLVLPGLPTSDFSPPVCLPNTADPKDPPLLYIARYNLGWFAAAVALAESGMSFYCDQEAFSSLCVRTKAVEAFWFQNMVTNKGPGAKLKMYYDKDNPSASKCKLSQAAENGLLGDFSMPFKVFQAWGQQTTQTLEHVALYKVSNKRLARFWLSTVHKVKGIETPYVQLANDFIRMSRPEDRERKPDDETFLAYVAATRAMRMLFINSELRWVMSPRVPQEPCPCLKIFGQDEDSEEYSSQTSTQLPPPASSMSLLDMRQLNPLEFQALRCSAPPTAWLHNPWTTLDCPTNGPWHRCGVPGCPRPWFRHREAPKVSVCLRYSYPDPGESYQMCSACARCTIFGDFWGAC